MSRGRCVPGPQEGDEGRPGSMVSTVDLVHKEGLLYPQGSGPFLGPSWAWCRCCSLEHHRFLNGT